MIKTKAQLQAAEKALSKKQTQPSHKNLLI